MIRTLQLRRTFEGFKTSKNHSNGSSKVLEKYVIKTILILPHNLWCVEPLYLLACFTSRTYIASDECFSGRTCRSDCYSLQDKIQQETLE